jgi:hypothetical protein
MRFLLGMASCVIALGLAPVWAQHGGGHASAGGHAFGGGHASGGVHGVIGGHAGSSGHSGGGGGHIFSGAHSGAAPAAHPSFHSSSNRSSPNRSLSSRNFNHSRSPHRGPGIRIRTRTFRNCFWFGCSWGYPYSYLGGGIDPNWWWNSGSSDDQNQQYGSGSSNDISGQNVDDPRTDEQGDQDVYARSAPPPPRDDERTEAAPLTVLVFRDQHKQEVQNYAIVGQTLWTFAPQHTQKIPLSDLDLPATTKANDERGVDFRLPGAHEGQ